MKKFRFRWQDHDEIFEGKDIYEAFGRLKAKHGPQDPETTLQVDLIRESEGTKS